MERRPFLLLFVILSLCFVLSVRPEVLGLEQNVLPEEPEQPLSSSFHLLLLRSPTNQRLKLSVYENRPGKLCKMQTLKLETPEIGIFNKKPR